MPEKLNFLIPIDFNPESKAALRFAVSIAKDLDARLHLLYILEEESPLLKLVIDEKQRDLMRRGAADKLDEIAGKVIPEGLEFTSTVRKGKIYDKIIEAAGNVKADLILMGRTDSSALKKNLTGTNTMHIIKAAEVPVITLRQKPSTPGCSHIILPLDLTKQTIKKASNAVMISKILQARITVVSFLADNRKSIEIKFTQRLDKIRKVFEKLEVPCSVKLVKESHESWHRRINESIGDLGGDLVMIMTQQEMDITDYFIGSHAQDIINKSEFPVLSINPLASEIHRIPDPMVDVFIDPIRILDR